MPKWNRNKLPCTAKCAPIKIERGDVQEFVGPVKIVMVEPSPTECLIKAWVPAILILANLYMAIIWITMIYYTLTFRDKLRVNIHIALCTTGFQLLLPSALMMLNNYFSGTMKLDTRDKIIQHLFLEIFATIYGVGGVIYIILAAAKLSIFSKPLHSIPGFLASGLLIASLVKGVRSFASDDYVMDAERGKKENKAFEKEEKERLNMHEALGILSFVFSSLSFIAGVLETKNPFIKWTKKIWLPEVPQLLALLCFLTTVLIVISFIVRAYEHIPHLNLQIRARTF